jgi:hypothetical protein
MPSAFDITRQDLNSPIASASEPRIKRQFLVIWDQNKGLQFAMPHGLGRVPDEARISLFAFPGLGMGLFHLDKTTPVMYDDTNVYLAKMLDTGSFGFVEVQVNHSIER